MQIHINLAVVLHDWFGRHKLTGPVLTLGRQEPIFQLREFKRILDREPAQRTTWPSGQMTARQLFDEFDLGAVSVLDMTDQGDVEIVFDLNEPDPPVQARQRFGLIINGGALEHIFHVPNALANLNCMLRPGGAILHVLPCNNWVDHGFYQFSPTLVFSYYAALQFDVLESAMMIFNPRRNEGHLWEVRAVPSGISGSGESGGMDDRTYLHVILVRRGEAERERLGPIARLHVGKPRSRAGPRWFSPFDLDYGARIDHPNRYIVPLRDFSKDEGLGWTTGLRELKDYADGPEFPIRSPLVMLENERALGPPHASHAAIRTHGGGSYSHWEDKLFFSTSDDSDPNSNGRRYVAVIPPPPSF